MPQRHDQVLQGVGGRPGPIRARQCGTGVHEIDERRDRGRVGRVVHDGGRKPVERDRWRRGSDDRLDVGRIPARRAAHEAVLADLQRSEELLGRGSAHGARHRRDDHERQPQPLEQLDVGIAMPLVRLRQTLVVQVEAVRVLHHELAAAQQPGTRAGLVAVLGLDLIDDERQVAVRVVEVLHHQGEHLFVGRREQHVGAPTVLQAEQVRRRIPPSDWRSRTARGAAAPGNGPPGTRRRPSPRARSVRRCDRRSTRAAATRSRQARRGGCIRPAPAAGGSPPPRRPGRRGGFAGTGSTCAARPRL